MTLGLDQTAVVYAENATTGLFDVVVNPELKCRLAHLNARNASTGSDRQELASLRRVLWEPSYVMPEGSQLLVDGVRWQPVRGTFAAYRGPAGQVSVRAADAVRQI